MKPFEREGLAYMSVFLYLAKSGKTSADEVAKVKANYQFSIVNKDGVLKNTVGKCIKMIKLSTTHVILK